MEEMGLWHQKSLCTVRKKQKKEWVGDLALVQGWDGAALGGNHANELIVSGGKSAGGAVLVLDAGVNSGTGGITGTGNAGGTPCAAARTAAARLEIGAAGGATGAPGAEGAAGAWFSTEGTTGTFTTVSVHTTTHESGIPKRPYDCTYRAHDRPRHKSDSARPMSRSGSGSPENSRKESGLVAIAEASGGRAGETRRQNNVRREHRRCSGRARDLMRRGQPRLALSRPAPPPSP